MEKIINEDWERVALLDTIYLHREDDAGYDDSPVEGKIIAIFPPKINTYEGENNRAHNEPNKL